MNISALDRRGRLARVVACVRKLVSKSIVGTVVGAGVLGIVSVAGAQNYAVNLRPATAQLLVGKTVSYSALGYKDSTCSWSSSNVPVLAPLSPGSFRAQAQGKARVSVTCGKFTGVADVLVLASAPSAPIAIFKGGTYSGIWASNDPKVAAVSIYTNEPVVIQNSVITGKGNLIAIFGTGTGANVQVQNVSGFALDPGVSGVQRPQFVAGNDVASLTVQHCSMYGVSFGVNLLLSTAQVLKITDNAAYQMEDRASDGKGGLLSTRPLLGHFVILDKVTAPYGAEIAWNQIMQVLGASSMEDVINIYKSQGGSSNSIAVHDNYMEGYSSTTSTSGYTGTGVITDGDGKAPFTAYVQFNGNEMVHTAGVGVSIASGHDNSASDNRVVSCGKDPAGGWYAMSYAIGQDLWDYYNSGTANFYNNTISNTLGGLVRPSSKLTPMPADSWVRTPDISYPGNGVNTTSFSDPCLVAGVINLAAETAERAYWQQKLVASNHLPGDQHF